MSWDKKRLLTIAGVVLLLLGGLGYYLFANQSSKPLVTEPEIQEEVIPTISPEDIGLVLSARSDSRAVKFVIEKAGDIASVDYEISYTAKGDIPRGAIGHVEKEEGDSLESNYIDLGTCSSGRCKYDEGVTSVKLTLKITKTDGTLYQAESLLDL